MHNIVHSLSVDFKPHDFNIKLFIVLIFLEISEENVWNNRRMNSFQKNLVCTMITISENVTQMSISVMDLWCNCEKQKYQDFHFLIIVSCDTSTIRVNVGVLLRETFFNLVLNILTHHFTVNIS